MHSYFVCGDCGYVMRDAIRGVDKMKLDWTAAQLRVSTTKPYSSYVRTVLLARAFPAREDCNKHSRDFFKA